MILTGGQQASLCPFQALKTALGLAGGVAHSPALLEERELRPGAVRGEDVPRWETQQGGRRATDG